MMLTHIAAGFGTVTAGALMTFGLYATVKTRGLPLRGFRAMLRQIRVPQRTERRGKPDGGLPCHHPGRGGGGILDVDLRAGLYDGKIF